MEEITMTISCNEIDPLLLEGDPIALQLAERHAQGCAPCAEKLASWSDTARQPSPKPAMWL